ncbi:MAG: RIP metalloprotease RseP [Holosporaceae bacterium]|jgi:regulator of sigma E protease|nr:RIP metalloprotease RseP [Holosporaceae bacterium]
MAILYYLFSFLVTINIIVVVHEYGHYLAAKKIGVKVVTFSIGMGPEIFGWNDKHGTRWCFSLLPVGGYVMMLGDGDAASATEDKELLEKLAPEEKRFSFSEKSNWEKMCISFCGPFFNYIYAFVVVIAMSFFHGLPSYPPVIGDVQKGSPAEKHGLLAGDRIISMDGEEISKYRDVAIKVTEKESGSIDFVIKRNGKLLNVSIVPEIKETKSIMGEPKKTKLIGIRSGKPIFERKSLWDSLKLGFSTCVSATGEMFMMFGKLFSGQKSLDDFGGVVHMASVAGDLSQSGNFALLIMFTVTLSLNLGFINLFPLPILDGGRILICLIEEIIRKKLNEKLQERIMIVCAALLIFLMLITTVNDILRIEAVNKLVSSFVE